MDNKPKDRRDNRPKQFNRSAPTSGVSSLKPLTSSVSRGAAVRAQKRTQADAQKIANQYAAASSSPVANPDRRANFIDDSPRLKIIGLGGMDGGGSKNMMLV